jgi:hypothetical protein
MFIPPANSLGADLIWWRTSDGLRTIVSLTWGRIQPFADAIHLQAILFAADGQPEVAWRIELPPDQPVFIDSDAEGPWSRARGRDGVLALYACTDGEPSAEARKFYNRLVPLVDWRRADGQSVILHSEQIIRRGLDQTQEFTEIVVLETTEEHNTLVLLNGEQAQDEGALVVQFRNARSETRVVVYASQMLPFTAHRIEFAPLSPGLAEFAGGQPLLVSGRFASRGLKSRPYIETTGERWGAYHAGNLYHWGELPFVAHALIGGEVNPFAVLHDDQTRTIVNLLHSHGSLEEDIAVDAALFDLDGHCVAHRPSWLVATRHALARAEVGELIPDPSKPFRGHLALSFAPAHGKPVPRRLQALVEYSGTNSVARVMTWSDEWNSRVRLARRERRDVPTIFRSYFRVCLDAMASTEIAVTNAGHPGYDRSAEVKVLLKRADHSDLETMLILAPFATKITTLDELFPGILSGDAMPGHGIVLLESSSDLASMGFTRHRRTGALAAEHFLVHYAEQSGELVLPAGS